MKTIYFVFQNVYVLCLCLLYQTLAEDQNDNVITRSKRNNYQTSYCPPNTECIPINSCTYLSNVINNQCFMQNRYNDLSCGYTGSGMVCCPKSRDYHQEGDYSEHKFVDGVRCGLSHVFAENYQGLGSYPWVARIGFKNTLTNEVKYPCAGSIISNRVILTAAHCALAKAENFKLYAVKVGEYSTNSEIDCGPEFCGLPPQDIQISHVVVHPGYEKQTFKNNIALLVLQKQINYTVTAQPICLPEAWSVTNSNGILVGWGKTAGQTFTPPFQQVLKLPIIDISKCYTIYGKTLPVSDEQLCAGGEYGNDACSGFGGSPLLVKHGETYFQVGILSFGSDQCGKAGVPSVYTNIKKYVNWIKDNMPLLYNNN